jgi:hypothetical protein
VPGYDPYGGYIWSDESASKYNTFAAQAVTLGAAAAAGLGVFAAGTTTLENGTRPIDFVVNSARFAGNMSPFQIGNTFRIPEWFSPYTSALQQGLKPNDQGMYTFEWDKAAFSDSSSFMYLQEVTGLDRQALADRGIKEGMTGLPDEVAEKLVFERTAESSRGSLYSIVGNEKKLLSDSMQLMSMGSEQNIVFSNQKKLNRAAKGVMQSLDLFGKSGFDENEVLSQTVAGDLKRPQFMPTPSISGPMASYDDFLRRTSYLRAIPAFEMQRFNDLVSNFTDGVFGSGSADTLRSLVGFGGEVRPGTASAMFMRYGLAAGGVGAALMGVQQVDWIRRNYSLPGQIMASGAIAGGVAYATNKLTKSPKTAMMAGVASFFGQIVLPGFDQGVVPGLATTYTMATKLRANAANPLNYYRRTLEGFLPGSTDWKTGAFLGIGLAVAPHIKSPFSGRKLSDWALENFGDKLGIPSNVIMGGVSVNARVGETTREVFWNRVLKEARVSVRAREGADAADALRNVTPWQRAGLLAEVAQNWSPADPNSSMMREINRWWSEAEDISSSARKNNPLNVALIDELEQVAQKYSGAEGPLNRAMMEAEGFLTQTKYAFFGASATESTAREAVKAMGYKGLVGRVGASASLFIGALGAQQILTGGLLGSMETSQELEDIYSGKQLVEVRKSRYWEGGGTPFEGGDTTYYRPHQYHLMMNRVREKGIWGAKEDEISPIGKFFRKNFTYFLEKENYYTRPYPISAPAFSDVPVIGGLLGSTIGRLVKPPRLMHTGEWMRPGAEGNIEFASVYQGSRSEPAYALGADKPAIPGSPYDMGAQLSYMSYQFRELEGLTGWAKNMVQSALTGSETFGSDQPLLADSGLMTSARVRFWETQMGGLFFSNEALRRLLPRYRSDIERRNPIMNSQPSWLPEKFRYGDPYRNLEWGEARLPGAGYQALHPELQGLDPEDYPLIYQYSILADVAPFSKEFRSTRERMYYRRQEGQTTEQENRYMDAIDNMVKKRYNKHEFDRVNRNAIEVPGSGATQAIFLGGKQTLRNILAPLEYMTPMGLRPAQKLLGDRDMISQYEYERMYGTPYAFWDKPWRDWFRPALYSTASMLGYDAKPMWREEADAESEYFDKLDFIKWMRLAEQAEAQGDGKSARQYKLMASGTRAGVNPQGNPLGIYWSLPESERKFFNAFAHAKSTQERDRILEMVPADQRVLYETVWSRMDSGDPGMFPGSPTSYDDAYLTQQYYSIQGYFQDKPLPKEDWVGWHEDVDMEDIKVKYVDERGRELQDYGLWEKQLQKVMRQQFLEGSTDFLHDSGGVGNGMRAQLAGNIHGMVSNGFSQPHISVYQGGMRSHMGFRYDDDRKYDTVNGITGMLNEY